MSSRILKKNLIGRLDRSIPPYLLNRWYWDKNVGKMKEKLYSAIERWNLTEIKTIYEHETKAVYSAVSEEFGPVILKVNRDTRQLGEEYEMLHKLNGNGCCKIYAFDEENGVLLEERFVPGTVLREEEFLAKRVQVFKNIFSQIHQTADEHAEVQKYKEQKRNAEKHNPPQYLDWLEDVYRFCVERVGCAECVDRAEHAVEHDVDESLMEMAKLARDACEEMFAKYPERILLHGDLHHDNILKKADGTYGMIDPKGVIGPEILDIPRYIMNEIDTPHRESDEEHMKECVHMISRMFGYPLEDVVKVYFMEVILGNLWSLEDGDEINEEEVEIVRRIYQCIIP